MTLKDAKAEAHQLSRTMTEISLAVVNEGIHADEFAVRDTDGNSYGYCPEQSVRLLYRYGTVIEIIPPQGQGL